MKTINEVFVAMKVVRERITDLKALRGQIAVKETFFGAKEKTNEPLYDVKKVDKKIVELQNWLNVTDAKIKMSNAITQVDVELNMDDLLSPLE